MNTNTEADSHAVAGPVEPTVRPVAWLCEYRSGEKFVSLAKNPMCDPDVRSAFPLYDQAAIGAAVDEANRRQNAAWALMCEKMVAAERERWIGGVQRFVGRR